MNRLFLLYALKTVNYLDYTDYLKRPNVKLFNNFLPLKSPSFLVTMVLISSKPI